MSATIEEDPLHAIVHHLKLALSAAEASGKQVSAWQQRATKAEASLTSCQLCYAQNKDELLACRQQCQTLQEQLAHLNHELIAAQSAKEDSSKQAAAVDLQLLKAQQDVSELREQLQAAGREHQKQCSKQQGHIQQLQEELQTVNNSRDLLLQQLQQQEAQLQELLESAVTKAAVSAGSDDELPSTQYGTSQPDPFQQQELAALKAQVCHLLNDNAVLQVRNESLDQQLAASKLQMAQLQQQVAAAVAATHPQADGQHQPCRQLSDQHEREQSKVTHDKAYYKRKYIDIKAKYDTLKQQWHQSCTSCRDVQGNSNQQHGSNKSRLAGIKRQHCAEVTASVDRIEQQQQQQSAQLAGRRSTAGASRSLLGQAGTAPAAVASAVAVAPHAMSCVLSEHGQHTPSKPVGQNKQATACQSSPATAAAAARLAAAFSPLSSHKKRRRQSACGAAVDNNGPEVGPLAVAAAVVCGSASTPPAVQTAATKGFTHTGLASSTLAAPVIQQMSEIAGRAAKNAEANDIKGKQQQQPCSSGHYEPTVAFAPGTDGTQDTVDLVHTDKQQQQQQQQAQQQEQDVLHDRNAGLCQDRSAQCHECADNALRVGAERVISNEQQQVRAAASVNEQTDLQQQLEMSSPAWRVTKGSRNSAAVDRPRSRSCCSSRGNSIERDGLPNGVSSAQAGCKSLPANNVSVTASAAAGKSGAAECDSDFDSPPKSRVRSKHRAQQRQQEQQSVRSDQGRSFRKQQIQSAADTSELSDVEQQQQQRRVAPMHGGRQRSITPSIQHSSKPLPLAEQPAEQQPMQQIKTAPAAVMPSRYSVVCSKPVAKQLQPPAAHVSISNKPETGSTSSMQTAGSNEQCAVAAAVAPAVDAGGFKYQEVVRGKAARELLPAFECEECRKFYTALQSWGPAGQSAIPACGHAAPKQKQTAHQGERQDASNATGQNGRPQQSKQLPTVVHDMMQNAGRHRAKWRPPSTPPGFWHIGFTPDHDRLC